MKPLSKPGFLAKKAGRPEISGFTICSTRRSLILAKVLKAILMKSMAWLTGWPWKLPALITAPGNTRGLSVTLLASVTNTSRP